MTDSSKPTVNVTLDDILSLTPSGPIANAIGNNLYGINHRQTPTVVPLNKDQYGYTFFTRPQLNMTTDNLRQDRKFYPLLSTNPASYQRFIRCTLDPRLMHGYEDMEVFTCPFVDPQQAFIPLLSNHLTSISGWPDVELPSFTDKQGMYKEEYSMPNGIVDNYTTYDLTATYRNSRGDVITQLIQYWTMYSAFVFEGRMSPYPEYITQNMRDYDTRIYRIILDASKTRVQAICACGVAYPTAVPLGNKFDFAIDQPYNTANASISVPFRCMGVMYNDPILIQEFNSVVSLFNVAMEDSRRDSMMVKIPTSVAHIFNGRGYPRIDTDTLEMQWWVSREDYTNRLKGLNQIQNMLSIDPGQITGGMYA